MTQPKLLVIYHMIPEDVFQFVVEPSDLDYQKWIEAHNLIINSNDEDYPEEICKLVSNMESDSQIKPFEEDPLTLEGSVKIIHCGFIL